MALGRSLEELLALAPSIEEALQRSIAKCELRILIEGAGVRRR